MGREWGLEEAELQWPVSAYPLSAVRFSVFEPIHVPAVDRISGLGLPVACVWPDRRFVRQEENVRGGLGVLDDHDSSMRLCEQCVPYHTTPPPPFLTLMLLTRKFADVLTLDVLRGVQGIGSAATIPASVRPSQRRRLSLIINLLTLL